MNRTKIKKIFSKHQSLIGQTITLCGWIRSARKQKSFSFLEVNDGSSFASIQVIVDQDLPHYEETIVELTTGSSVAIIGEVVESPGSKQPIEIKAKEITLFGNSPADEYPLQKKRHSFDFLRTIAHLRPRTNTQGAVARVRNQLSFATHRFFQERGFLYLHSPIITGSDCEGAGQLFQVTTLDLASPPRKKDQTVDMSQDFFGKPTYLTVSGQLNAEAYACALSDVYTFGPTFRAENSHTARHLAEFWMIEPELAFADINDLQKNAVDYIQFVCKDILEKCQEDLAFFNQFIDKGIIDRLKQLTTSTFAHLTYTEVVSLLEKSNRKFEFPIEWGSDLQSEHERYIAEEHCKLPVIITDYPKKLKAFYMRDNDDGKTVSGFDVIVPKIGEIIGGSQREERYEILKQKFRENNLDPFQYEWYLDLRKYGSVPHGGYGVGFERLVQFVTGMDNIRDVIAFPRVPGHADF